jgi:hypothetical protein
MISTVATATTPSSTPREPTSCGAATANDTIVTAEGVGGDTADGGLGTNSCRIDAGDTHTAC